MDDCEKQKREKLKLLQISCAVLFLFKQKLLKHSLLLCGEDFKAAVCQDLIEHLKKRNRHPRKHRKH